MPSRARWVRVATPSSVRSSARRSRRSIGRMAASVSSSSARRVSGSARWQVGTSSMGRPQKLLGLPGQREGTAASQPRDRTRCAPEAIRRDESRCGSRRAGRWEEGSSSCLRATPQHSRRGNLRDYRVFRIFRNKGDRIVSSTVTAAEISKNFGAYQDAAVRAPVIITKNGRPRTVLMAYEDFVRLSKRDRRVQRTTELSEAEIAAVEASEMAPGYEHLNAELDTKHAAD